MDDVFFMKEALALAQEAFDNDEVPVGAVIVRDNEIIASAGNTTRSEANPLRHAELRAIEKAALFLNNERLDGCSMYVTKEPCAMCAGAIVHARIKRLVIGAPDIRYGACGTVLSVCGNPVLNHVPEIVFGVLAEKSSLMLKDFFREKRALKSNPNF